MAEREELRLCVDFEELRAGMLVQSASCSLCGRGHRGILVLLALPPGDEWRGLCWEHEPSSHPPGRSWIEPRAVDLRLVYIIDTGNDDEAEQDEGRRMALVASVHEKAPRERTR